ncbi:MAG: TerB family tellurite resistance protein [Alphaproteobacteria bacterium]|nr:TerB family tellurite resistance protein [Alphaproteobacteria bacterium]
MDQGVTDSQFFMWRTLFAVAHADNVVTSEEIGFMAHILEDIEFSDAQVNILKEDVMVAQDPVLMFKGITEYKDRVKFFEFARDLVWVDGDFASEEQGVMIKLGEIHNKEADYDKIMGHTALEFEDEEFSFNNDLSSQSKPGDISGIISNFGRRFVAWFDGK